MVFNKAYIGNAEATKGYLGNILVFDNTVVAGVDVFPQTGAASAADINNIAPFTSNSNCATTVETTEVFDGLYAIKIEDIGDGSFNFVAVNFPVTAGKTYNISVFAKGNVASVQGFFVRNASNSTVGDQQTPLTTSYAEYTVSYAETVTGNGTIRFYTTLGTGSPGDIIYIDKVTIIEV